MPWSNRSGYQLTESSIIINAPAASGAYGLYAGNSWIYFGESEDIQRQLLEHVGEMTSCIKRNGATHFKYELVPGLAPRVARQDALILEFRPPCNEPSADRSVLPKK